MIMIVAILQSLVEGSLDWSFDRLPVLAVRTDVVFEYSG